ITNVTLVVNAPVNFSLSATPASRTVTKGQGTGYTVTVTPTGGFNGTVGFKVSGLPRSEERRVGNASGTRSGNTTKSETTAASTRTGSYPLTIPGTSATPIHTTNVTLVLNAPVNFSLSATPGSRTVTQGQGTGYTVTVTPTGGFNGTVGFKVSGLPAGAGATFNPTTVTSTGNTTMSVTTAANTPTGSYPLTITGTSGSLSHSVQVTLFVVTSL